MAIAFQGRHEQCICNSGMCVLCVHSVVSIVYTPPVYSVHVIFQARILEHVGIFSLRVFYLPGNQT